MSQCYAQLLVIECAVMESRKYKQRASIGCLSEVELLLAGRHGKTTQSAQTLSQAATTICVRTGMACHVVLPTRNSDPVPSRAPRGKITSVLELHLTFEFLPENPRWRLGDNLNKNKVQIHLIIFSCILQKLPGSLAQSITLTSQS